MVYPPQNNKLTCQQAIDSVKRIDDLALLKQLHLVTISVKSLEEFDQLINS